MGEKREEKSKRKRRGIHRAGFAVLCLAGTLLLPAKALTEEAPYYSYRYDSWGTAVETAQTYQPEAVISGETLGVGSFSGPTDLSSDSQGLIYLLDAGNSRVVVMDREGKLRQTLQPTDGDGKPIAFEEAGGIFVSDRAGQILITDKKLGVMVFNRELRLLRKLEEPDSDVLPDDFLYAPTKVLMDSAGIYYVISANCYEGALQFDENGRFLGFYGSERVVMDWETRLNQLWKSILTDAQAANMKRTVPVEFVSFCVDEKDFIYTVRQGNDVSQGQVKKCNALGENILPEKAFGDLGTTIQLIDITVDDQGYITILDGGSGRMFQYDEESNLLFAFGGKGGQTGLAETPAAVEAMGEKLLLLDSLSGRITVLAPSAFARSIRSAVALCADGKYQQAMEPWREVLRQDNTYGLANRGLGKAYEGLEDYATAASYYRKAYERELYGDAFGECRTAVLREYFGLFMGGLAVLVLGAALLIRCRRRHRKSLYEQRIGRFHYPLYCMFHPFTGYEDLKERRKDSLSAANLLLLVFFVVSILVRQATGFTFNENRTERFSLPFTLLSTIGMFVAFVICNWSITTIADGKGRLKEVWNYCAYALLPYCIGMLVVVVMSNLLSTDEAAFLSMAQTVVYLWTGVCLVMALKEVHMYSLGKTLLTTLLTLAGMVVVLLLCAIGYTVVMQLISFISNIYTELRLR